MPREPHKDLRHDYSDVPTPGPTPTDSFNIHTEFFSRVPLYPV